MIHSIKSTPVVLDLGSYMTFAGVGGEENPRLASHSYLTTDTIFKQMEPAKFSIGQNEFRQAKIYDQIQSIYQEVNQFGQVSNYQFKKQKLEPFIEILLTKYLDLDLVNQNVSILITQDPVIPPHQVTAHRQQISQFLFQYLQINSLTFIKKPVLSSFSLGRSSALVLDSGHSYSKASAVEDGFCVFEKHVHLGGGTIHGQIFQLLDQKVGNWKVKAEDSPENFSSTSINFHRMWQVEKLKHSFKTIDPTEEEMFNEDDNNIEYNLPDGNRLAFSRAEIIDPFTKSINFFLKYLNKKDSIPSFLSHQASTSFAHYRSLEKLAVDTIDEYLKRFQSLSNVGGHSAGLIKNDLCNNIVLTGGNFLFGDLMHLTKKCLKNRGMNATMSPIYSKNTNESSSSWIGGSIATQLSSFNHFWVSKKDWNEGRGGDNDLNFGKKKVKGQGMSLINKKCP